jgi:hypothetical protein
MAERAMPKTLFITEPISKLSLFLKLAQGHSFKTEALKETFRC